MAHESDEVTRLERQVEELEERLREAERATSRLEERSDERVRELAGQVERLEERVREQGEAIERFDARAVAAGPILRLLAEERHAEKGHRKVFEKCKDAFCTAAREA